MKMKKALVYLIVIICSIGTANAQWHFYLTSVNYNSNCNNLTNHLEVLVLEQIANSTANETYSSLDECEAMRNMATIRYSKNGCSIRTTTSPCVGGVISGGASGAADILGPSQGRSFYTTNPANEIKNWSSDDIERHLALDQKFQTTRPEAIVTTDAKYNEERATARENSTWYVDPDKPFVPVNLRDGGSSTVRLDGFSMRDKIDNAQEIKSPANQANVQQYVNASTFSTQSFLDNPQDLTQWLHDEFKKVSGFDLDAIMQKLPQERTEAEKQALIDYQEYRKALMDKIIAEIDDKTAKLDEVKDFEMAALSGNSYKDADVTGISHFMSHTNYIGLNTYKGTNMDFLSKNPPIKELSALIDECNSTNSETGFHAELYYNEKTNEYTIAFEGTNFDEDADIQADILLGTGGVPDQYKLAYRIGQFLNNPNFPSDIKINITGHSLGGGDASVVGLVTGRPTYTYNAAGISENVKNEFGLNGKSDNNIKAFQDINDPLSIAQEADAGVIKEGAASLVSGAFLSGEWDSSGTIVPRSQNSSNNPLYEEGKRLQEAILSGNNIIAPAVGNKIKVDFAGELKKGHSIESMTNGLKGISATATAPYNQFKHKLYQKGHGVEEQTQDRILIKLGN